MHSLLKAGSLPSRSLRLTSTPSALAASSARVASVEGISQIAGELPGISSLHGRSKLILKIENGKREAWLAAGSETTNRETGATNHQKLLLVRSLQFGVKPPRFDGLVILWKRVDRCVHTSVRDLHTAGGGEIPICGVAVSGRGPYMVLTHSSHSVKFNVQCVFS